MNDQREWNNKIRTVTRKLNRLIKETNRLVEIDNKIERRMRNYIKLLDK